MSKYGVIIVSHSAQIAEGIYQLTQEVAKDVHVSYVGGSEDGGIGTSFDALNEAISSNEKDELLAFFDLGSAKMNLEIIQDMTQKTIHIYSVPVVEGAYTASAMLQADTSLDAIENELNQMAISK